MRFDYVVCLYVLLILLAAELVWCCGWFVTRLFIGLLYHSSWFVFVVFGVCALGCFGAVGCLV